MKAEVTSGLASAVRDARARAGLTQAELARRSGVTASYISRIEAAAWTAGGPWPSDDVLRAVARVVGVSSTGLIALRTIERGTGETDGADRRRWGRNRGSGRYSVVLGHTDVQRELVRLVEANPPRGALRLATNGFPLMPDGSDDVATDVFARKLAEDTTAVLYGVCMVRSGDVGAARAAAERLAGGRDLTSVHNLRLRYCVAPPAMFELVWESPAR